MKKNLLNNIYLVGLSLLFACGSPSDEKIIEESGILESTEISLSSKVIGTVDRVIFDEGDKIKVGDTLLIIDHIASNIRLKQAVASEDIAKAKYDLALKGTRKEDRIQAEQLLRQTEAVYHQAEKDNERFSSLLSNKTISKKQYEDVQLKFDIARSQYLSAKENYEKIKNITRPEELTQAKANYEQAKAATEGIKQNIQDCYIISPINGYVTKRFQEKGETVTLLSSLVKVADLTSIEANIYVSETEIGKVKPGQSVEVKIDSFPDKVYKGKVKYISPEAEFTPKNIQTKDERTKLVFKVKTEISNPKLELKPGLPADIKIITD